MSELSPGTELKDMHVGGGKAPPDVGAEHAARRIAVFAGVVAVGALTLALTSVGITAGIVLRTDAVPVPVDQHSGRVVERLTGGAVEACEFRSSRVKDVTRKYIDLAYAYDFREGPARALAAVRFVDADMRATLMPPPDALARLQQRHTRIRLEVTSMTVQLLEQCLGEVTVTGTRVLLNDDYPTTPNGAPFQQRLTLRAVSDDPVSAPLFFLVRAASGDLSL